LAELARVIAGEEPETASALVEEILSYPPGFHHMTVVLAAAWVGLVNGDASRVEVAEAVARDRGEPAGLAEARELRAMATTVASERDARLDEALAMWRELGNPLGAARCELALAVFSGDVAASLKATATLRELGVRVDGPHAAGLLACLPPLAAAPVEIQTLGGFQVLRDGRPVPLSEWKSKKARDLLKILATRRGRAVPRDALMEALWPDEDPSKLSNRLSVALSLLRGVLDPDDRFAPDHFVDADAGSVALVTRHVALDVERFLEDAAAGLAGESDRLEYAEARYAGDFLEADAYEDWAVALREEARAVYVRVARVLADRALETGQPEAGGRQLRRILERDAYDERAHLALVSSLEAAGQHGEARRAYRAYSARMDEIDVEPAPYPSAPRAA
jgi:DNA-binding SARP family transcriptional activator